MGYYSTINIEESDARTQKSKEQLLSIINKAKLFKEAFPIGLRVEPDDSLGEYPITVSVDKEGYIELIIEDHYQKWYDDNELAYLLSQIVDSGHIIMTFTGEDGACWGYKVERNKVYYGEPIFKFRRQNNKTKQTIKKHLIQYHNEQLFVVNLTKELFYQFDISDTYQYKLSYLLYDKWNKDKIVILGEFYKILGKNLWEETYCEKILSKCKSFDVDSIKANININWFRNKVYYNYDKKQQIDIYKSIASQALTVSKDKIISPIITSLLLTDNMKGKWARQRVGIIEIEEGKNA